MRGSVTTSRALLGAIPAALLGLAIATAPSAQAQRPPSPSVPAGSGTASAIPAPYDVPMAEKVANLVKAVRHYGGKLGMSIVDLRTGKTVVASDASQAMNPASNAKLLTAWAALRALGPQHRYLTGLYGRIRDDRVDSLVLRGEGDPSLEHEHLYAMVSELRLAGVRMVGDIVVDQSRFDDKAEPPAYDQQPDEWASFRAPVSAVAVDGNTVHISVFPGISGQQARVQAVPPSVVGIEGAVGTTAEDKVENVQLEMLPLRDGKLTAKVGGGIPMGGLPLTIWRRAADPSWLAGHALADVCRQFGIEVHGKVRRGHPVPLDLLAFHRSEPLGKLLHALGKHSDNFNAEMIFKGLGAKAGPASFDSARARVFELLAEAKIDSRGLKFENGSGLFDADRMSAAFITTLLSAAARDPSLAPEYLAQLSIGGVDGTLRNRFEPFAQARTIRGKSGTLRAVSALSGYVLGTDGRPAVAFSFLVNDVLDASTALRQEIDEVVAATSFAASLPL